MAAVDISSIMLVMGDYFLGERVCLKKMGVTGIADLLNGEFGHNGIGVLILECWIRVEMGSGLLVSDLELSGSTGSCSPVCSSLE
jgi:hypothetical protein